MFLSLQQRYILDLLHQLHYARTDQLHTLVQERYRAALPGYTRARTDAMLRQLRGCIPYFRIQNDIASLSLVEPDHLYLEAIDVMLTLSEGRPQGVARSSRAPRMLSFVWGREHLHRFTVARLEEATPAGLALVNQGQLERILWLTPSNTVPDGLSLPLNQFLVIRQPDGTHRFYGPSTEHT